MLKSVREKQLVPLWYKRTTIKLTADFSSNTMEARELKEKSGKDMEFLSLERENSEKIFETGL